MPNNLKDFYKSEIAPLSYFKDENDFKTFISDKKNANDFYESEIKPKGYFKDFNDFDNFLKKKESLPSQSLPTPLPSVSPLEEGSKVVSGQILKEKRPLSIDSAIQKDKQNQDNWLAAMYNKIVDVAASTSGGFSYLQEYNPFSKIGGKLADVYSLGYKGLKAQLSGDKQAQKEVQKGIKEGFNKPLLEKGKAEKEFKEAKEFIEQARSEKSSKEYEQSKQFDYKKGFTLENLANLGINAPAQIAAMASGVLTGGNSFFYQAIGDNVQELEKLGIGDKLTDGQKLGYLLTQASVQTAFDKFSVDKMLNYTGLGKKAVNKITGEIIDEFAQKGIKATTKEIQDAAIRKASQFASKAKRTGLGFLTGALPEAVTEGLQSAGSSGIKYATNKLVGKEIFDEEDLKKNFIDDIVNSTVAGGAFGGMFSGGSSLLKNTNKAIRNQIAEAQTPEDLNKIQNDLAQQVELGNITPEEAESANITAQQYAEIAAKIPNTVEPETKSLIIGGIQQREQIKNDIQKITDESKNIDESFLSEKQANIDLLNSKLGQVNDYLDGLVTGVKTEYVQEGDKYFKVDSKGEKIEIPKDYYDIAIAVNKENERKAKESKLPTEILTEEPQAPIVEENKIGDKVTVTAADGTILGEKAEITAISPDGKFIQTNLGDAYIPSEQILKEKTEQPTVSEPLKDVESTAKSLGEIDDKSKLPLVRNIALNIKNEYEAANKEIERLNNEKNNLTDEQKDDIIKKTKYKKSEKYPDKYEYNTGASIIRKTKEQLIDDYYTNKIKKIKKDEPREGVLDIYRKQDREYSNPQRISEAYHKAKLDGSNPELVKAVEDLLGKPKEEIKTEPTIEARVETEIPKVEPKTEKGVSAKTEPITEPSKTKPSKTVEKTEIEKDFEKAKENRGIRNANMKKFVKDNLDSIVSQLKIKNKISRECN